MPLTCATVLGFFALPDGLHCPETDVFLPPDEGVSAYEEESGAALYGGVPLESTVPLEGGMLTGTLQTEKLPGGSGT
ncbi:hypothetical protein NP493_1612g00012 [Ridgeia piscesae]|uniref:Uncharacterized protein n=1 Tax=Ridgeia piscesae TaxID=27915 RepID=A0AAD9JXB2_RIDPI|nr:hypothetical protein NP493_1612g00012 [Ridgeia piscesae]